MDLGCRSSLGLGGSIYYGYLPYAVAKSCRLPVIGNEILVASEGTGYECAASGNTAHSHHVYPISIEYIVSSILQEFDCGYAIDGMKLLHGYRDLWKPSSMH